MKILMALVITGLMMITTPAYAGGGGAKNLSGHLNFVEMDRLLLPIIDNNGVSQVVSLSVVLEVESENDATMARHLSPKLKDAFLQDLYGVLTKKAAMPNGVVHVKMIKKRLGAISSRILGEGKVNDVLLQVVRQNPV